MRETWKGRQHGPCNDIGRQDREALTAFRGVIPYGDSRHISAF